jgi:hypothetical protein
MSIEELTIYLEHRIAFLREIREDNRRLAQDDSDTLIETWRHGLVTIQAKLEEAEMTLQIITKDKINIDTIGL